MTVLAAYNIKGGVGKTATAVNLAWLSAQGGARTLLWDLDPQGAASFYFRARPRRKTRLKRLLLRRKDPRDAVRSTDHEGLDVLPADFSARNLDLLLHRAKRPVKPLRRMLKILKKDYDVIYLDCAPGIGLTSECVFAIADVLVVPTIPTPLSVNTLRQLRRYLSSHRDLHPQVLPFFSMVDRRRSLHRDICDPDVKSAKKNRKKDKPKALPYPMLKTRIPYSTVVERMGTERLPVPVYAGRSESAEAYRALHREVFARMRRR